MDKVSNTEDDTSMISEYMNLWFEISIREVVDRFEEVDFFSRTIVLRESIVSDYLHEYLFGRFYVALIGEKKITRNHQKIRTM